MSNKTLTWLHLSDLHRCSIRDGGAGDIVLRRLQDDLRTLRDDHGLRPDLVFMTGDLAFGQLTEQSLDDQLVEGWLWLEEVRQLYDPEVPVDHVFLVPGNHDIDRTQVKDKDQEWLRALAAEYDKDRIHKLLHEAGDEWRDYMGRLAAFESFIEASYPHLADDGGRCAYHVTLEVAGLQVGVAGFNSAWSCGTDDDKGHLWLGEWQVDELVSKLMDADVRIALVHHPFNWLVAPEDSTLRTRVQSEFHVLLHGHEHHLYVETPQKGHLHIAAGAVHDRPDAPLGYNVVRFDLEAKTGEVWLRCLDHDTKKWMVKIGPDQTDTRGVWPVPLPWEPRIAAPPQPPPETGSKHLRIFISYGHDEHAALAQRLKESLEAKGHQVWFDQERLKPDGDREAYIEDGLDFVSSDLSTGRFVLVMTPHSVRRPDGFCLNEITRAIQRRIPIVPVMAVRCEPPLSICRIQWFDMTDCVPVFERTDQFESRMEQLADVLQMDRIELDGLQARLHLTLDPLPFDADITKHLRKFEGREWVFDRIDDWLADPDASRIFWITGSPGVGKTAIAAYLCTHLREVGAFHLCQHGHLQKADSRRVVLSIAYQLSSQLPQYQTCLKEMDLDSIVVPEANALTLFDSLVIQPLASLSKPDRTIVVLIDALDEAAREGKNELASFIATQFDKTPSWLRLIITSRPDKEVTIPLQRLTPWVLDASNPKNEEDIRAFLKRELVPFSSGAVVAADVIDAIVGRSESLFLYVRWVMDELKEGRLSLDSIDEFPQGLGGVYVQFFERQFDSLDKYKSSIRPALDLIAAAREPLELTFIASILGWEEHDEVEFTRALGSLYDVTDGKIEPFHKSVMDWLADADRSGRFFVSARDGVKPLTDHCLSEYESHPKAMAHYALTHLVAHLQAAENQARLTTILTDLDFIQARAEAGQIHELVMDYNAGIASDPEIEPFSRFVKHDAHIIQQQPDLLFQQAINQPDSSPVHLAALKMERPDRWVRWVNKPSQRDPCLMTLTGHTDWVTACAFSPDGLKILSGSHDKTLKLWDASSGSLIATLEGHSGSVEACAFSRSQILSGSHDGTLKLWDASGDSQIATLEGHSGSVRACAFSSDGSKILSGSDDKTLKMWDASSGSQIATLEGHSGAVRACAFSSDGSMILSGSDDKTLKLWDAASGSQIATLKGHSGSVEACAFSPDGSKILSASYDRTLKLWDVSSRSEIATLEACSGMVRTCTFSPDGSKLLSGHSFDTLKVWDASNGSLITSLEGHGRDVKACAFSPDGSMILSASNDRTLKLWDAARGPELAARMGHSPPGSTVWTLALSPDGSKLLSGSGDYTLKLWNATSGSQVTTLGTPQRSPPWEGHTGPVWACAFSPDGSRILSGSNDGTVKLWDAFSGSLIATLGGPQRSPPPLEGNRDGIRTCAFSLDGSRILSGSGDTTLKLWDVSSGSLIATLGTPQQSPPREGWALHRGDCAFSPDGLRILSGSGDTTLRLWDASSGSLITTLADHSDWVEACAFSPDGSQILSSSTDRTLKLWDAPSGSLIATLESHSGRGAACAFSPDGSFIVAAGSEGISIFDVNNRKLIYSFADGGVKTVALGRCGRSIVAGNNRGLISLLELEGFQPELVVATPVHLFRHEKNEFESEPSVGCEWCGKRFFVSDEMLGSVIDCAHCGEKLKLNPFKVDMRPVQ